MNNPDLRPLIIELNEAEKAGNTGEAFEAVEEQWMAAANIQLFSTTLSNALRAQAGRMARVQPEPVVQLGGWNTDDVKAYVWEFGKLGSVWHFVTLAGLHSNAYIGGPFARPFATEGMKAYVKPVQRYQHGIGCDVLT
ncbi:Pyruvate/Phosphoenolpyruvate kinase-like domain-containing protein [Trametes polyzona]|nr:Pyruvate/Phosphoenolpyruvate kinase-like domain-containing protein [Trametes polyzona]